MNKKYVNGWMSKCAEYGLSHEDALSLYKMAKTNYNFPLGVIIPKGTPPSKVRRWQQYTLDNFPADNGDEANLVKFRTLPGYNKENDTYTSDNPLDCWLFNSLKNKEKKQPASGGWGTVPNTTNISSVNKQKRRNNPRRGISQRGQATAVGTDGTITYQFGSGY